MSFISGNTFKKRGGSLGVTVAPGGAVEASHPAAVFRIAAAASDAVKHVVGPRSPNQAFPCTQRRSHTYVDPRLWAGGDRDTGPDSRVYVIRRRFAQTQEGECCVEGSLWRLCKLQLCHDPSTREVKGGSVPPEGQASHEYTTRWIHRQLHQQHFTQIQQKWASDKLLLLN